MFELPLALLLLDNLPQVAHIVKFEAFAVVNDRDNNLTIGVRRSPRSFELEFVDPFRDILKLILSLNQSSSHFITLFCTNIQIIHIIDARNPLFVLFRIDLLSLKIDELLGLISAFVSINLVLVNTETIRYFNFARFVRVFFNFYLFAFLKNPVAFEHDGITRLRHFY